MWADYPLDVPAITGDALSPYIQDVLDELEFILGDATTSNGALRAQYGQEAPFNVTMVEIGNENMFEPGCSTYASRFTDFYDAIHMRYPTLRILASTTNASCLPSRLPRGVWADQHHLRPRRPW